MGKADGDENECETSTATSRPAPGQLAPEIESARLTSSADLNVNEKIDKLEAERNEWRRSALQREAALAEWQSGVISLINKLGGAISAPPEPASAPVSPLSNSLRDQAPEIAANRMPDLRWTDLQNFLSARATVAECQDDIDLARDNGAPDWLIEKMQDAYNKTAQGKQAISASSSLPNPLSSGSQSQPLPIIYVKGGRAEVASGNAVIIDSDGYEEGLSSAECQDNLDLARDHGAPDWLIEQMQDSYDEAAEEEGRAN